MSSYIKGLAIILMLGAFLNAAAAAEEIQEAQIFEEVEASPYRFSDRLATDAAAYLTSESGYTKRGVWAEDRFIFPGAEEEADILLDTTKLDDKPIEIIELQLHKSSERKLQFEQMTAGKELVLRLKASSPPDGPEINSVYLTVYLGTKLLDKLRLAPEMDWISRRYTFKSARFLKEKLTLTLKISTEDESAQLSMLGYIKR